MVAVEPSTIQKDRQTLHLSQTRLAALSGVSRFKICLYKHGEVMLNSRELQQSHGAIEREAQRIQAEAQAVTLACLEPYANQSGSRHEPKKNI
jgi:predicted transcriptional regulator